MNRICTLIYSTVLCLFILTLGSNIGWVNKQCIFGSMLCRFDLFSNIHNHNIALDFYSKSAFIYDSDGCQ